MRASALDRPSFGDWVAVESTCWLKVSGRPLTSLMIIDTETRYRRAGWVTSTRSRVARGILCVLETVTGCSFGIERGALFRTNRSEHWAMFYRGMVGARIIRGDSGLRDLQGIRRAYRRDDIANRVPSDRRLYGVCRSCSPPTVTMRTTVSCPVTCNPAGGASCRKWPCGAVPAITARRFGR